MLLAACEEDEEGIQEATPSLAAATEEIIMDAAVTAVLSVLHGIFKLKEEQRRAPKTFLGEQNLVKHHGTLQLTRWLMSLPPVGSLEL